MLSNPEADFAAQQIVFGQLGERLTMLLHRILDEAEIEGVNISYRVKTLESAKAKVRRLGGATDLNDLTDILGVRLVAPFDSEIDAIAMAIAREFAIVAIRDSRLTSADYSDELGRGIHIQYVLRLAGSTAQLPEWSSYADLTWELQVVSELGSAMRALEHELHYGSPYGLDPRIRESISALLKYAVDRRVARLRRILGRFQAILDSRTSEEELQRFLTSNTVLLEPSAQRILPKFRLGSEFVTDFVMELAEEEYVMVELEPAHFKLFTSAGNPSARLIHAQRQVEDWREWTLENISYIRQSLPGLHNPAGLVVIGRRRELSSANIRSLRRKNSELHRIRIETYDDLLERVRRYINNLQAVGF